MICWVCFTGITICIFLCKTHTKSDTWTQKNTHADMVVKSRRIMGRVFLACCHWCLQGDKTDGGMGASAAQLTLSVWGLCMSMCSTRETPRDFPAVPGRMAVMCVQSKSHPTVCSRVFVLRGGGQCRDQRFHVHNEVFMAQGVKTSTLTKLGSENINRSSLQCVLCLLAVDMLHAAFRLCEQM